MRHNKERAPSPINQNSPSSPSSNHGDHPENPINLVSPGPIKSEPSVKAEGDDLFAPGPETGTQPNLGRPTLSADQLRKAMKSLQAGFSAQLQEMESVLRTRRGDPAYDTILSMYERFKRAETPVQKLPSSQTVTPQVDSRYQQTFNRPAFRPPDSLLTNGPHGSLPVLRPAHVNFYGAPYMALPANGSSPQFTPEQAAIHYHHLLNLKMVKGSRSAIGGGSNASLGAIQGLPSRKSPAPIPKIQPDVDRRESQGQGAWRNDDKKNRASKENWTGEVAAGDGRCGTSESGVKQDILGPSTGTYRESGSLYDEYRLQFYQGQEEDKQELTGEEVTTSTKMIHGDVVSNVRDREQQKDQRNDEVAEPNTEGEEEQTDDEDSISPMQENIDIAISDPCVAARSPGGKGIIFKVHPRTILKCNLLKPVHHPVAAHKQRKENKQKKEDAQRPRMTSEEKLEAAFQTLLDNIPTNMQDSRDWQTQNCPIFTNINHVQAQFPRVSTSDPTIWSKQDAARAEQDWENDPEREHLTGHFSPQSVRPLLTFYRVFTRVLGRLPEEVISPRRNGMLVQVRQNSKLGKYHGWKADFCTALTELALHPMWQGDVDLLGIAIRYVVTQCAGIRGDRREWSGERPGFVNDVFLSKFLTLAHGGRQGRRMEEVREEVLREIAPCERGVEDFLEAKGGDRECRREVFVR